MQSAPVFSSHSLPALLSAVSLPINATFSQVDISWNAIERVDESDSNASVPCPTGGIIDRPVFPSLLSLDASNNRLSGNFPRKLLSLARSLQFLDLAGRNLLCVVIILLGHHTPGCLLML